MSTPLSPGLRNQLAKTVQEARRTGETGARQAIRTLAVDQRTSYDSMSSVERTLRRRLRVHGRQLGDRRDSKTGNQEIRRLTHEVAYEHWHRMLFARFLAENQLLIEPDSGVAISLDECEELARERGQDCWTLAGSFAQRMLPRIFRPDAPALAVRLAPENRQELERLVESLPDEVFAATDSLGWVYQFWQSEKKNEVNRSEVKIGADELPAVTQLFTEPYMVSFLLDNGLGAWWAARRLSDSDLKEADSEAELRRRASIPGVPLDYLRFVQHQDAAETTMWRIASGNFDDWPEHLGELKILDPCCGSGHFLVAAFSMLVPLRMAREHLTARAAVDAVLQDNLHGLELDPRCVELAAFALALAAWTYPGAGGYRRLPDLNLACSGLAPNATKEQWLALAEPAAAAGGMPTARDLFAVRDSLLSLRLRNGLRALYDLFAPAPTLGSLIEPRRLKANLYQSDFESVRALLAAMVEQERTTEEQAERAVAAQGMARAAELLAGRYHWVITNVPYLARGKQDEMLRDFCARRYATAKIDLATVFLERCLKFCAEGGTASLVLPQNWLFLARYRKLRERLLKTETWHLLARLGEGGFNSSAAAGAFVVLLTLSHGNSAGCPVGLSGEAMASGMMYGLDVSEFRTPVEKAVRLAAVEIRGIEQVRQLKNPDARVAFEELPQQILGDFAACWQGIVSSDDNKFVFRYWEVRPEESQWEWLQLPPQKTNSFTGRSATIRWDSGIGMLHKDSNAHNFPSLAMLERPGIAFQRMRDLNATLSSRDIFADHVAPVVPHQSEHRIAIWCWATSAESKEDVRKIDSTLKAAVRSFIKTPFDLAKWAKIAQEKYPNGLPHPYSDDPTQWIFHGHPCGSVIWDETDKRTATGPRRTDATVLQIAVARLLGYRWPAEQDADMELADEQREWVRRCDALLAFADKDGIVCIPPVRGEPPAWERLLRLLSAGFGEAWNDGVLSKLLSEAGGPSLDQWLRNRFFDQHCKLFRQRPFIWHVWDGRSKDGFHALVNYHRLAEGGGKGRRCLESLTYSYLGDWINRQRDGTQRSEGGAEGRLVAALELQRRLIAVLEGEPPYDIFVRWKSLAEQTIGWEPDINDGVRLNIRPFMAEDIPGGRKGAGILRVKPNIHWRKDRGKEPLRERESFPWFWNCPGGDTRAEFTDFRGGPNFDGNRWNDLHYTNAARQAARSRCAAEEATS